MKIILIFLYCSLFSMMLVADASEKEQEKKQEKEKNKAISTGDQIYTWIDEKGNRIYSDQPREGAEVMNIPLGTDYTPTTTSPPDWDSMRPKVIPSNQVYSHFQIVSPTNDATVRNNDGSVQVALDIRPKLSPGHKIKIEVDGVEVPSAGTSIIALNNIDRGSHSLVGYIVTAKDEVIATTDPVIVHVHRAIKKVNSN